MLDEKDLQAIAGMIAASEQRMMKVMDERESRMMKAMDERTAASEQRMMKAIDEAAVRATSQAIAYVESDVSAKLDLIKEGLDLALETRIPPERIYKLEDRMLAVESIQRRHAEEIAELKKAQ